MKILISSFLLLLFINSCQKQSTLIEARVTNVTSYYDVKHYDLPHVTFSISLRNLGNNTTTLYVNEYGRDNSLDSGSFWVYYNDETDSLKLFSASCENCNERTMLKPEDSLNLALQIHYSDIVKRIGTADSVELISNKIKEVFENWNVIRYFDSKETLLFETQK